MEGRARGGTNRGGQGVNPRAGNPGQGRGPLRRIRGGELEEHVESLHTRVGTVQIPHRMEQGEEQKNIGAGTNGEVLSPALGTFGPAWIDPDDPPSPLHQAVEHRTPAFEMDKAGLTDRRVRPEE